MASTVTWQADRGTAIRKATDGSPNQGAGDGKRIYVGRYKPPGQQNFQHHGYLRFALNWSGVGQIVSAVLTLYADNGFGELGDTMPSGSPKVYVRRLTEAFSERTGSEVFDSDDYDSATSTSSGAVSASASRGSLEAVNINITSIVEAWAPKTVKKRNGKAGTFTGTAPGLYIYGNSDPANNYAFISEDAESELSAYKPVITLTYELGHTTPDAPTNLTPTGSVTSIGSFQGDFDDVRATDLLSHSNVQVYDAAHTISSIGTDNWVNDTAHGLANGAIIYFTSLTGGAGLSTFTRYYVRQKQTNRFKVATTNSDSTIVDITNAYEDGAWSRLLYNVTQSESNAAVLAGRFDHVADFHPTKGVTYRWRARVRDHQGDWSPFSGLTSFVVTNTDPDTPTVTPNGSTFSTLDSVLFRATFSDDDAGNTLLAYQFQMSPYAEGDARWADDTDILWNTGKRYVAAGSPAETPYGGASLTAGTYYVRARVWDNHHGVSGWGYAEVVLDTDFVGEAQDSTNAIQLRPRSPWRIVIKGMGANRGPGTTVAVLEDAYNVGASLLYNSPGEAHWTLGVNHPQLSVIEPKQTHYAIEFRQGDGWREVFAGLVWDIDANDRDVIFYGIDYLALLDLLVDEKYDPASPEKSYTKGGSKYSQVTIRNIILNQLTRARQLSNSPVGFISTGSVATMNTTLTVYSTYQPVLTFIVGLLDSHRAGAGKFTRLSVQKTTAGGYAFVVQDDPGVNRDNLRLRYGELVQGYRIVPFGNEWATRVSAIGRDKDGIKVRYKTVKAPGINEATYGRFMRPVYLDGVSDSNDLTRRTTQLAVSASMLGKQVALGLRSGFLQPRDGYDLLDRFKVDIEHGSISTTNFGHNGYWAAVGITWTALQRGDLNTTLTLRPIEEGSAPSADLLVAAPISTQREWQIGWASPNPLTATSRYWLDQTTGIVYERRDGTLVATGITGDV